jgi:hypothetical protein
MIALGQRTVGGEGLAFRLVFIADLVAIVDAIPDVRYAM